MPTLPVLKRFDMTVYKNRNGTIDPSQVPAQAKIEFYRQGATVKTGISVPTGNFVSVVVYNTGDILEGHTVQLEMDEAKLMLVGTVNEVAGTISLKSIVGTSIALTAEQRLVDTSARPNIYTDPLGSTTGATSVTTDSTTGPAGGYLKAYRYDFIVKIPPTSPTETRLHLDAVGSFVMR